MTQDPDFDRIYRLLGVDPKDGWDVVQQAYRRKAQAFHPDRAGGNPKIEKIATMRFEELNQAFEELRRFKRIFGDLPPQGLNKKSDAPAPTPLSGDEPEYTGPPPAPPSNGIPARWVVSVGAAIIIAAAAVMSLIPD